VPQDLADKLCGMGATSWTVPAEMPRVLSRVADKFLQSVISPTSSVDQIERCKFSAGLLVPTPGEILSLAELLANYAATDWDFLTHCTRAPAGPWPEQSEKDYIDELLTQLCPEKRSPLTALSRILTGNRIMGTSAAIRGGTRTVCFTAVPLEELHRLRVFQPQRQRWDFEPYGICIRQSWLEACGARPVIYGDDDDWESLCADDRPFFQLTETRRGNRRRSWTKEKEWRHVGDIELAAISADNAVVFVPTQCEAESLARMSRWPIVVLQSARSAAGHR
jgi:hypothetical protein